jgi:hypothetical protein
LVCALLWLMSSLLLLIVIVVVVVIVVEITSVGRRNAQYYFLSARVSKNKIKIRAVRFGHLFVTVVKRFILSKALCKISSKIQQIVVLSLANFASFDNNYE